MLDTHLLSVRPTSARISPLPLKGPLTPLASLLVSSLPALPIWTETKETQRTAALFSTALPRPSLRAAYITIGTSRTHVHVAMSVPTMSLAVPLSGPVPPLRRLTILLISVLERFHKVIGWKDGNPMLMDYP
ncbi:hypothetical protein OPQ81_000830 [Rhizoctonia solani]|nr:hypothetical protein OPQ81_000830 [Rhizoctonia solani]